MRGGREQGKSATATVMEYCRSPTKRWGLSIQSKTQWFDMPEEITLALGKLREKMESGQLIVDVPCVVHIPRNLFNATNSEIASIRILDLPGDNPANNEEQKHVTKMAKTYLPFADLILLVGRGDDLGFLRPNAITLPGIEDWQSMPHRFRVVTTYSYTAQSVRQLLRENTITDIKLRRSRLIDQIERFGALSEAAKDENMYFPLEFGSSWESVKEDDFPLYERMSPFIAELRSQLLTQIATATNPMGRLRSMLNTHTSVKYIKNKRINNTQNEIKQLNKKKLEISKHIEIFKNKIPQTTKEINRINEILNNHPPNEGLDIIKNSRLTCEFNNRNFPPKIETHEKNRNQLINLVRAYYQAIKIMTLEIKPRTPTSLPNDSTHKDSYWIQIRNSVIAVEDETILKILDEVFSSITSTLEGYYISKYFLDDNYKKDYTAVCRAGEVAKERIEECWKAAWINALKAINKKHKELLKKFTDEHSINMHERDILCIDLKEVEQQILNNEKKLTRITQESKDDLERCDQFIHLLNESYLEEIKNRMDSIYKNKDDCDAVLQLLSLTELASQRKELMELSKNPAE